MPGNTNEPSQDGVPPTKKELEEIRTGVTHAFKVLREHSSHTKGYVEIALKYIDEFGDHQDKEHLNDLILDLQKTKKNAKRS